MIYDVIIIGAGPAGIAAAIQLQRYNLNIIIFESDRIGGLLRNANLIENYPGFPNNISGPKICDLFEKHILKLKVPVSFSRIIKLNYSNNIFEFENNKEEIYKSKYCVLASGTRPKLISEININSNIKINYDILELRELKNKEIIILGGGDAAFDYALNLSKNNRIKIIHRNENFRALDLLIKRAEINSNIKIFKNQIVNEILKSDERYSIICSDKISDKNSENESHINNFESDFIIATIGREAQLELISENADLKNNPKLFIIGDCINQNNRQAVIAAGDGLKAAMNIYRDINNK